MANFTVPLNRIGVLKMHQVDIAGDPTSQQAESAAWSLGVGASSYFSLVVSADGLTAEIHPIAEGTGTIIFRLSDDVTLSAQDYDVQITANSSDPGPSGNHVRFVGASLSVVQAISSLS
jgi:hypothetical protein